MKGSAFIFDCINLLRYKCHKTSLNHDKSYIDSPDLKKKNKRKKKKRESSKKSYQLR